MQITLLVFGILNDILPPQTIVLPLGADTHQLQQLLHERYPDLEKYQYGLAKNQQLIHQDQPINEGDEIALLPPFSGG
jgi:molybdopterin synthase sulfur carrier subunit